jgi:hypothetical protein
MIQFLKKRLVWLVLAAAAAVGRRLFRSWWRRRRYQEEEAAVPPEQAYPAEAGEAEAAAPTIDQTGRVTHDG